MPDGLNEEVLGLALLVAVNTVVDKTDRTAVFRAMAGAIIDHFKVHGIVTVQAGIPVQVTIPSGTGTTISPGTGSIA